MLYFINKKKLVVSLILCFCVIFSKPLLAQNEYRYSVDLNKLDNDVLTVNLLTPKIEKSSATFSFPKIIPGTYAISDYGKFVSDVKAFDKSGNQLRVKKISED